MNNYEKYKDEIIKMLIYSTKPCRKIRQIRTYLWLRLRSENQQEDSGFLISHKDMSEHYVIEEVFA